MLLAAAPVASSPPAFYVAVVAVCVLVAFVLRVAWAAFSATADDSEESTENDCDVFHSKSCIGCGGDKFLCPGCARWVGLCLLSDSGICDDCDTRAAVDSALGGERAP